MPLSAVVPCTSIQDRDACAGAGPVFPACFLAPPAPCLPVAPQTLGYAAPNMRFVEGQIEDLQAAGIGDESIDLVISNCVVSWPGASRSC